MIGLKKELTTYISAKNKPMNSLLKSISILIILIGICGHSFAQGSQQVMIQLPKTAMVAIAPYGQSTLTIYPEFENNVPLELPANSWVNYSSIKESNNNPNQHISAAITEGSLPEGFQLVIEATGNSGQGGGTVGFPVGSVNLTEEYEPIIVGIGSCYTGSSAGNGHQLFLEITGSSPNNEPIEEVEPITITFQIGN
jgi:hypothetical protein